MSYFRTTAMGAPSASDEERTAVEVFTTTRSHDLLVAFLARQPTAVVALLAAHVDDGTGKCRMCGARASGDRMPWPCTIYQAAVQARSQQGRRGR